MLNLSSEVKSLIISMSQTGSNYICHPPVINTDIDYVVYTKNMDELIEILKSEGWSPSATKEYDIEGDFMSLKKRSMSIFPEASNESQPLIDLIITDNEKLFSAFISATRIAKELNLRVKDDRVELFRIVKDSFLYEG